MHIRTCTFILFASSFPLLAHHQFSSEYDQGKPMNLSGTIVKVDWAKPHAYIYLDVTNQNGKTEEWKLETASPAYLEQHGLNAKSFKGGEQLRVSAYGATNNSRTASARMVVMPDGKSVQVADPQEDGGPAK